MSTENEWTQKMLCVYTQWSVTQPEKEWNNAICNHVDGPGGYHTKGSKPDRERQMSYDTAFMRCSLDFQKMSFP